MTRQTPAPATLDDARLDAVCGGARTPKLVEAVCNGVHLASSPYLALAAMKGKS